MDYLKAFIVGGLICVTGQILIDKTQLTSARILVLFVVVGCILGGDWVGMTGLLTLPEQGPAFPCRGSETPLPKE